MSAYVSNCMTDLCSKHYNHTSTQQRREHKIVLNSNHLLSHCIYCLGAK